MFVVQPLLLVCVSVFMVVYVWRMSLYGVYVCIKSFKEDLILVYFSNIIFLDMCSIYYVLYFLYAVYSNILDKCVKKFELIQY